MNAIMNVEDHSRVSLGVIPVGTGNDYVRNFKPTECFMDIDAQLGAEAVDVDLTKINDLYSFVRPNIDEYVRKDDKMHLTEAGIDACAAQIVEVIKSTL